ncbi:MAG: type IV pilus modification protein PilV [Betaproteobacteria bacterium]|nr:MAG: type IV pilus modification protein PilV [Betaproteobacteria bacterium]
MNARSLPKVNSNRECGVSLLEALITIVILAFGILGLAGLQSRLQTVEVEAYARSQALILLDDMAARLSAHRGVAATYVAANPVGTGDTQPTDCSGTALGVERDTCEWSNALTGNTQLSGSSAIGVMIGGRGCIEQLAGVDPPSYRVTVTWQGLSPTVVPSVGCGQSLYGANDALRRTVVKVVSIAALGP